MPRPRNTAPISGAICAYIRTYWLWKRSERGGANDTTTRVFRSMCDNRANATRRDWGW